MRTKLIKDLCYVALLCSLCVVEEGLACNRHQRKVISRKYAVNRHGNACRHHYRTARVKVQKSTATADSLVRVADKPSLLPDDGAMRHLSSWITFVSPEQGAVIKSEGKVCGVITPVMEEILSGKYGKSNALLCTELNALVSNLQKQSGVSVNSVQITGYSSPKGSPSRSEKISMKRISAVKEMFRRNFMASEIPVKVGWIGEDWDTLSVLIRSSDIPMREAVMGIVDTRGVGENREHMLSLLDKGIPYLYMKQRLYGKVERVKYEVEYTIKVKSGEESKEDSDGINYRCLYTTACRYSRDTKMFADLTNLAAQLYPDNAGAGINAGAVALLHHDILLARKYLERYATRKEAFVDMGILCALEGREEKASLYFQMAAASGSPEGVKAAEYLKREQDALKRKSEEVKKNEIQETNAVQVKKAQKHRRQRRMIR